MKRIIHVVNIDSPRENVFAAITTEEGLSSWWSTRVQIEEDEIHFVFLEGFNPVMKVVSSRRDESVDWRCIDGHEPWKDNSFSFRLSVEGGRTQLLFTQDYAIELSDIEYGTYNYNWAYYLESLRTYCETGRGKPFEAE